MPPVITYVKRPWITQPPAGVGIDWSNSITHKLVFLFTTIRGIPYDEVNNEEGVFDNSPTIEEPGSINADERAGWPAYRALECSLNSGDCVVFSKQEFWFGNTEHTIMCLARNRKTAIASTGNEYPFSHLGAGDDPLVTNWTQAENYVHAVDLGSTFTDSITDGLSTTNADPRTWNLIGGIWRSDTLFVAINQSRGSGTAAAGTTQTNANANNAPRVGGDGGNGSWDGWVALVAFWTRGLADEEWNACVRNPWLLFKPALVPVYVPTGPVVQHPYQPWSQRAPILAQ